MAPYSPPIPSFKLFYCSLFDKDTTIGAQQATEWVPFQTAIHRPLRNLALTFITNNFDALGELCRRHFTPTTKTRNSGKKNPAHHPTVHYEFGSAPHLSFREGAKDLLQGSFHSPKTYGNINHIVKLETTKMIVIHAFNTSIVPGPDDPFLISNHTIIAACTFHIFQAVNGVKCCFLSYIAVTNKQYTKDTVTGFADNEQMHQPFRDSGYGFAWLMLQMASMLSATDLTDSGHRMVGFAPVYLQVQKASTARSMFLRNGFVPTSVIDSERLSHLEGLSINEKADFNYQSSSEKDIESLSVIGKLGLSITFWCF